MVNKLARWEREGIPHKGWKEMGIEDLGEDLESGDDVEYEQCEMCGQEKIRYVHILQHPNFNGELRVGCVPAEPASFLKHGVNAVRCTGSISPSRISPA